ncbi:dipeptidase [Saccharopolyspora sp. K220]|uniref:dipeptidase n=1 Tax=Saccharopolyspora soli TaxID=2926618 RepID=UPI001F5A25C9|nr:membrane dipeptidase [Saccharopolyspora soli]MCI2423308.1 dipeptidase [Saccharopolyspora soli]
MTVTLAADSGRLPEYPMELDSAQSQRVERLLAGTVISLHDHPIRLPDPLTAETWKLHSGQSADVFGGDAIVRSGLNVVLASALAEPDQRRLLSWAAAMRPQLLGPELSGAESLALAMRGEGSAVLLALEDLGSIGTDLVGIEELYRAGFRSAGLVYNTGNALGGGLGQSTDGGLTEPGRRAVAMLNDLHMLVDLSHVGDRTSIEAAALSTAPVVISHAGARSLWPSARMKPDDVLRAVADTGGVIGIEAAPGSTRVSADTTHDLDAVMAHVEYVAELVGVDHVGLGPDTFFGDHTQLYSAAGWSPQPVPGYERLALPDYVAGMENPAEAPRNAASWLVRRGWSDADIAKVLGANAARVLESVLR